MPATMTSQPTAFSRFHNGDAHAFDDVVAEYASPAYAVALKVLSDPGLAEEAVQEAFIRIWRNAHRFSDTRGSERTWILSVVRNQSIDMLRRRNRHTTVDIDAIPGVATIRDPNDTWTAVLNGLHAEEIRDALGRLPVEQRGVIQLGFFAGMRSVDIARSLNLPEGTVRSRMRLGLSKLRALLSETGGLVPA